MKNIYLIANNNNSKDPLLNLSKDDIVVRFNHMEYQTRKLFNGKTDILFLRYNNTPPYYYHGLSSLSQINNSCTIIPIGGNKELFEKITRKKVKMHINKESVDKIWNLKSSSSGLVAITYFLKEYPDYHLKLIGFNFHREQRRLKIHEFDKEQQIVKNLIKNNYSIEII